MEGDPQKELLVLKERMARLEDAVDNGRAAVFETARAEGLSMKEAVARVKDVEKRVALGQGRSQPNAAPNGSQSVPDWRDGESAAFFERSLLEQSQGKERMRLLNRVSDRERPDPEEIRRRKGFTQQAEQMERQALDRLAAIPGVHLYVRNEPVRRDLGRILRADKRGPERMRRSGSGAGLE
jgi:hypothetical protein